MTTLTYHPVQERHSPNATPPKSARRDECPLCGATLNRRGQSQPRYHERLRLWTCVLVVYCEHCNAASFATHACSPDGTTVLRRAKELGPTSYGLLRSPERFEWFLRRFPELLEVFEPA